jgi:hypothetical protein
MGCLARLGCLIVLAVLAIAAWFTRPYWMPYLDRDDSASETASLPVWQPLTREGARRAETELQKLERSGGPMYVTTTAGDLASYIVEELTRTLPSSADSIEVAAIDDRLHVRAQVRTSKLGDRTALGPLAGMMAERERIELAGEIRIVRPGLAELRVRRLTIGSFNVPSAVLPGLVRQIMRGERTPELSPEGVPLRTPEYIADVRVRDGEITLYKATR